MPISESWSKNTKGIDMISEGKLTIILTSTSIHFNDLELKNYIKQIQDISNLILDNLINENIKVKQEKVYNEFFIYQNHCYPKNFVTIKPNGGIGIEFFKDIPNAIITPVGSIAIKDLSPLFQLDEYSIEILKNTIQNSFGIEEVSQTKIPLNEQNPYLKYYSLKTDTNNRELPPIILQFNPTHEERQLFRALWEIARPFESYDIDIAIEPSSAVQKKSEI